MFQPGSANAYSNGEIEALHAILTDHNHHTEAAMLLARRMGAQDLADQLERVAALRDQRSGLAGLADDGTRLAAKRDALVSEVEQLWARGHRQNAAGVSVMQEEVALQEELDRARHALDRAIVAASGRGSRDEGVRAASARVQAAHNALAGARAKYGSIRTSNPRPRNQVFIVPRYDFGLSESPEIAAKHTVEMTVATVDGVRVAYVSKESPFSIMLEQRHDPHYDGVRTLRDTWVYYAVGADGKPDNRLSTLPWGEAQRGAWQVKSVRNFHMSNSDVLPTRKRALELMAEIKAEWDAEPDKGRERY
jgi:hypothetical protein